MVFKLKKTHCQQLPRTKHLYTSVPARIASKNEYFQLVLRAKHLLTSALVDWIPGFPVAADLHLPRLA